MGEYGKNNLYPGADYGLDPDFGKGERFLGFDTGYRTPSNQIGITTDARSANQLKAVSDKLATGAKTIEMGSISNEVWESVPQQHLTEINRLKKLAGIDLTLHGPLVEPTGVSKQGWDPTQREQAERQIWSAVQRANKLDPNGNIVVTFHSSNGLPSPETKVFDEKTGKEKITDFWVVDETTGNFTPISVEKNYLEGEIDPYNKKGIKKEIDKRNEDAWYKALQAVNYHANQGAKIVESALSPAKGQSAEEAKEHKEALLKFYKDFSAGKGEEIINKSGALGIGLANDAQEMMHGEIYLRDAYADLRNLFNQAYDAAKRNKNEDDLEKLDAYMKGIKPKLDLINKPEHVEILADELNKGVNLLRSIKPSQKFTPLREFAIDKASQTFANVAFNAYNEFKEHAPIISIENPPVGMGLSRAEELREVVEEARKKFVEKAKENGISEHQAKEQAKKLIGATWDVGHINMLRKYGHGEKELLKETSTIAPLVKHVHLSDNFGLEHTELPMGMGNVPIKKELEIINEYNKKAKKIIETGGNWYQFFQKSPLRETLEAFGSPIYGMKMQSYWNQTPAMSGGYFSGQGMILPDVHFQTYGAGFSGLPTELGGQIGGGRNRLSGAPME